MRLEITAMQEAVVGSLPTEFMKANWHLHAVIATISPNTILQNFYLGLLEVIEGHTLAVQPTTAQPLQSYIEYRLDLHRRMVDAIEAQDQPLARALVEEHNTENYQK
jgi:DNA-binding FadR family transcriptional regulator